MTPANNSADNDELWTADDLSSYLKIPKKTLAHWRLHGTGPPWLHIGKHVRYRPSDVRSWLTEAST
ncbi:helix-turn-helix transcriptional regulator [Amycolatopsis sp. NPDC051758]|uniref:helix-turn-helix transcriptional regulator n=1 Tax=Amycolatopsis sp. NPDC051758 TaxID=3363935 RepID=UPI003795B1C3